MIYLYWGNKTISFLRFLTLYSICKFNDSVTLIIKKSHLLQQKTSWKEKQDFLYFSGMDYLKYIKSLRNLKIEFLEDEYKEISELGVSETHTSDLLSWYILANKGGTVSDMDILYFKSIPKIEYDIGLISFNRFPKQGYIPVSFMQGRPNIFFKETYKRALNNYNPDIYESCGTSSIKYKFNEINNRLVKKQLHSNLVFPFAEKYPWNQYRKLMFEEERILPGECIGIHWYAANNQDYNNIINHTNFLEKKCTITNVIKKIYENNI